MAKIHVYFSFELRDINGNNINPNTSDLSVYSQILGKSEFLKVPYNDNISYRVTTSLSNRVDNNSNFIIEIWVRPTAENSIYTVFPLEINIREYLEILRRNEQNIIHITVQDTPAAGGALRKIIIDSDHPF